MRFEKPPAPPVVPGPDGATAPVVEAQCVACKRRGTDVVCEYVRGELLWLCPDGAACASRYRGGVSPATYAAGLRGELLAVAP